VKIKIKRHTSPDDIPPRLLGTLGFLQAAWLSSEFGQAKDGGPQIPVELSGSQPSALTYSRADAEHELDGGQ
jgi:hypothetical protein